MQADKTCRRAQHLMLTVSLICGMPACRDSAGECCVAKEPNELCLLHLSFRVDGRHGEYSMPVYYSSTFYGKCSCTHKRCHMYPPYAIYNSTSRAHLALLSVNHLHMQHGRPV